MNIKFVVGLLLALVMMQIETVAQSYQASYEETDKCYARYLINENSNTTTRATNDEASKSIRTALVQYRKDTKLPMEQLDMETEDKLSNGSINTNTSSEEFISILEDIEGLWTTKLSCDNIDQNINILFDSNGELNKLYEALSDYAFDEILYQHRNKLKSIIELGACQSYIRRTHSINYNKLLKFRLKNIYYSIDYIGLNEKEKIQKLASLLPHILTNKRFGAIALNFERQLVFDNINFVPVENLVSMEPQAANFIKEQIIWGVNFSTLSKFKISNKVYDEKVAALERVINKN